MALGIIAITPELENDLKELAAWAAKPENWHDFEAARRGEIKTPGADERYVRVIGIVGVMKCIFSWTIVKSTNKLYRHLSISVPETPDHLPNETMSLEVAKMLGFTGTRKDWMIAEGGRFTPRSERNVVILQELPLDAREAEIPNHERIKVS